MWKKTLISAMLTFQKFISASFSPNIQKYDR